MLEKLKSPEIRVISQFLSSKLEFSHSLDFFEIISILMCRWKWEFNLGVSIREFANKAYENIRSVCACSKKLKHFTRHIFYSLTNMLSCSTSNVEYSSILLEMQTKDIWQDWGGNHVSSSHPNCDIFFSILSSFFPPTLLRSQLSSQVESWESLNSIFLLYDEEKQHDWNYFGSPLTRRLVQLEIERTWSNDIDEIRPDKAHQMIATWRRKESKTSNSTKKLARSFRYEQHKLDEQSHQLRPIVESLIWFASLITRGFSVHMLEHFTSIIATFIFMLCVHRRRSN